MVGAKLVAAAFMNYGPLPDRPFRVLVHMCLTIKDDNDPPTYWGGSGMLCYALGVTPTDSGKRMARRAIADLEAAGAIRRANYPVKGRQAEYRLTFTAAKGGLVSPPIEDPKGGLVSPPKEDSTVRKGGLLSPDRGTPESPQGTYRGTNKENGEDQESPNGGTSRRARAGDRPTLDELISRAKKEGRI